MIPAFRAVLAVLLIGPAPVLAEDITVFAAASTRTALDAVAEEWGAATGRDVAISYAGSSALARQIEAGAPADIFISADEDWMDALEAEGLIDAASRIDLLGNTLVLIGSPDAAPLEIAPGFDLVGRLGNGKLAMALVEAVPAGIYGKAGLISLGVWDDIAPSVAQADNVRAALALVATGEAPMGIVYLTDAVAESSVTILGTFPPDSHPPITYPAALVTGGIAKNIRESSFAADRVLREGFAADFLNYLKSDAAGAVFEAEGFTRAPE